MQVHLIVLLKRLYTNQEATVRTEFGETAQHRHWERSATGMYPLTTTIQYIRRKHNERGFGRMGEWNQHRREDGDEPEIRRRYNTTRWDQEDLIELVERVRRASEKAGLYLNVGKIVSIIAQCTTTITRLRPIWNDQNITLRSKVRLMRTLIISILLYACETWTLTIELQRRIKSVEMRCYRRLMHIS